MKLTRKSYNRRVYTFGILAFLAVTLISTGFAAWVMSTNTQTEETGNAHVGVITDGQLSFVKNEQEKYVTFLNDETKFRFDAKAEDQNGEIKGFTGENATYENLSVTFSVTLTPSQYVKGLRVKLVLPTTFFDAADEGYIVLPDCAVDSKEADGVFISADESTTLTYDSVKIDKEDNSKTIKYTYTINFGWGSVFSGINPGYYLDGENLPEGVEDPKLGYKEKIETLVDFKKSMYGDEVANMSDAEILEYKNDGFQYTLDLVAESK